MTIQRLLGTCLLRISAISALVLTVPDFARAAGCFVRVYGNNPDYLEVTVDTHGMGPIAVLANVSFDVTFLLRRTDTKTSYDFTDDSHRFLEAGQVYRRYVPLPYPSGIGLQIEIVAGNCEYSKVLLWEKSDTPRANSRERRPIRNSHPPPDPAIVLGKVPPRFWP
jgi:hypothetical protein